MEVVFSEIQEADVAGLTHVMTRAFDDDSRKHLGVEKGGPDGYDNGEFFRKWYFPYEESRGYKITHGGRIIGGFIFWAFKHGRNTLGTIFVDPDYQDQGIGTRAWTFIEAACPEARSWELGTPSYAVKNQHFYEHNCGFRKVREVEAPEHPGTSFIYQKAGNARSSGTA